ncbi:MAG: PrpF family protein [Vannielia sp.]|uniref:2-methylaconitate cis-trans isomerase PrpF family protein n=1 Tax=Vannielia sp. TaxID=2813045 RepID=UPI003B8DCAC3
MELRDLPAMFMRGGTSNALVFQAEELPADPDARDAALLAAMGSPDPYGRQLDGMGGGFSSLSKVCILAPPSRDDADVDFTFAQLSVDAAQVDYTGNCGNMSAAMGPAALEYGLVAAPQGSDACIRLHNTNTGKIIVSHFPVAGGLLAPSGDLAIDGVAGTAAPIRLEFLSPGGAVTGHLLPSGSPLDRLALPDGSEIDASLVDAANPCVFVAAQDLGKTATELPEDLAADDAFMARMEDIRRAGAVRMGMASSVAQAAGVPSLPKVAIIAPPRESQTLSGQVLAAKDMSIQVRMLSMAQPHRASPITGAICLGVASRVPGTLPHRFCATQTGPLTIAHPSGTVLVEAEVQDGEARSGSVYRTARKLFSGMVHYRA